PWPMVGLCPMHRAQSPVIGAQTSARPFTAATLQGAFHGSPAIAADGTVYAGASGSTGRVYALNPNGTTKWSVTPGSDASPAIGVDGTVYVATYTSSTNTAGVFKGLSAAAGATLTNRSFAIGGVVSSGPAISADGGTVYVSSQNGKLVALNAADFRT